MKKPNVTNFARKLSAKIKARVAKMPRWARILSGLLLITGGALGFLPVLGFWMIPLGLLVLSSEYHWAKRAHLSWLRLIRRIGRWYAKRKS